MLEKIFMKKIIHLILILSLTNCGVQKKNISENQKIKNLITSLNYYVILPDNWKPILDSHDLLSYSPKNLDDIFYKNIIRIYQREKIQKISLKDFVETEIKKMKKEIRINSQSLTIEKTKYGETYIYKYELNWNFTHYLNIIKYFEQNGNFYEFSYSSDEKYYENYLKNADFIFDNLKFKE